jgi:dephospho-CoA kinase
MSEDEARARIASQASREDRLAAADLVVDNSGTLADLDRRINEIWSALTAADHRIPEPHPDTKR